MYRAASRKQYTKPVGKYLRRDCAKLYLLLGCLFSPLSEGKVSSHFQKSINKYFRKQNKSSEGEAEAETFKRKRSLVLAAIVPGSVPFRLV
jgi:hypothetical protein